MLDDYTTHQDLRNRFHARMVADPLLSRMATGPNRIWFSAAPVWLAPSDANFRLFQDRVHELNGEPVLLLHSQEQMLALAGPNTHSSSQGSGAALGAAASILAPVSDLIYKPDWLSFRYDAPSEGYLLVTDRWADGWEVTVNGKNQPVLGADFIYRAVAVSPGENRIQFRYQPDGFRSLLAVSWGTLGLCLLWPAFPSIRRRFPPLTPLKTKP